MSFGIGTSQQHVRVNGRTLRNEGPDTLYYRAASPVSSSQNDGSLIAGTSASLAGNQYVVSAGRSAVSLFANTPDSTVSHPTFWFSVPSSRGQVDANIAGATVTNEGPGTLYYRNQRGVSSTINDGSIAAGASAALAGTQWFATDSSTTARVGTIVGASIAGVTPPWVTAHRGGGASMAPEEAPSAWNWTANSADGTALSKDHVWLDGDCQFTSDSVLAMNHDATVDRTTDGTGNVSALTIAQFKALHIDPANNTDFPLGGWNNDSTASIDDFLSIMSSSGMPFTVEAKSSVELPTLISKVQAAGLASQAVIAVDVLSDVAVVKAAGLLSMFVGLSANCTQQGVLDAAPTIFAYSSTLTATYPDSFLQAVSDAGIKNMYYTLRRRSDHDHEMTRPGVVGGASDDPFYILRQNVIENSLDLSSGRYHHGMIEASASKQTGKRPTISGSKIVLAQPAAASQWMLLGSLADESQGPPTRITWTVTWDALGTDVLRWFALVFGCPDDQSLYFDLVNADNTGVGYIAAMRQNGQLLISRMNGNGLASTSLAAPAAANPITVAGTSVNFQLDYNKTTHAITLTRLDTNATATATDATYQGAYIHIGNDSQTTGQHVSFSNISVTR